MWHAAKANEKKIKELMIDHKRRAERRRAFYESRMGDPRQLLRVIGSSTKLYPDVDQYYYHANTSNLMPWQGDPDIRIDRFDGRALLEYLPDSARRSSSGSNGVQDALADELNFERYHDLVEAERLEVSEKDRLIEVETEWTKLLDRHKALLAMLDKKEDRSQGFAYDYGSGTQELDHDDTSELLKEADILQYVDDLTDKDRLTLNDMARKYGVRNYARLLRMAKMDRDDQLRELQANQKSKDGKPSGRKKKEERHRKRRRRPSFDRVDPSSRREHSGRAYDSSESESSEDEQEQTASDVVIEFQSPPVVEEKEETQAKSSSSSSSSSSSALRSSQAPPVTTEKKLTPMEKLRQKMRAGLEKQIRKDEIEARRKERERELELLQRTRQDRRPPPPARTTADHATTTTATTRYRSPSTSPPPSSSASATDAKSPAKRYYSPDSSRSPSPDRKRQRSPSPRSSRARRTSSPRKSSSRGRSRSPYHRRHRSSRSSHSRSPSRSLSRSPLRRERRHSPTDRSRKRYHHRHHHHHHHHHDRSRSRQRR